MVRIHPPQPWYMEYKMSGFLLFLTGCYLGLDALNNECPGGSNCWCPWDTAHEYFPPLDEHNNIICDDSGEGNQ